MSTPATVPLFANGWYEAPEIYQLRQEVQNLYRLVEQLRTDYTALEERVVVLEP